VVAVSLALLAGAVSARMAREPAGRGADPVALALPLILGITRIGCLLNGCCFGREAQGFGTVFLPGRFGVWADRYPTQPVLMVFDFLLFAWLWMRRTTIPYEGYLTVSFLLWFSFGRLVIDGLRDLPAQFLGMSFQQLAAALTFLCVAVVALKLRTARRPLQG
jgi:phosphatidylglycerol:prolipoprotein diacylglycerol transferase